MGKFVKKIKLPLSSAAITDGARSGLSPDAMRTLGMYSLSPSEACKIFGIEAELLVIPYGPDFARAKILEEKKKFGQKRSQKYIQPKNTQPRLYRPNIADINWEKIAKDTTKPLYITEGEKKAATGCIAGYPFIGLGGVYCFRSKENGFLPDWDKFDLKDRHIYIVYDSDLIDKPQVRYAEYSLSTELSARGAIVSRIRLPQLPNGEKLGLDDFMVAKGLPENIEAVRQAFDSLPREKIDPTFPPHLTELGNAIRFEQAFNNYIQFVPELKRWIIYDHGTGLWREDSDGEAMRCAKKLPYYLKNEAEKIKEENIRKAYLGWAKSCESERNLNATLKLASTEAGLVLSHNLLDSDPWKIAFGNGTAFNLTTLKAFQISPEDYFMKSFGTLYDPNAKCPRWIKFIHEIMNEDKSLALYLQRLVGWCLTGDMSEQCFFILYGTGANGKSTFLNILLSLFGDYGRQASPQTFMANKQDSSTRSDLVRLLGVRFIATSETENNQRIAEGLIKQWTGGEQISTRDLYGKTFEFSPQGKILLATNHKPRIHSLDHAIWRRVQLVPFTRTFENDQKDPFLADKLKEELPGILNWALEGYKDWRKNRLQPPPTVVASVKTYREDMDVIGAWLQENCEQGKDYKELISSLFDNHKRWTEESEEFLYNKRIFVQQMQERGFAKTQTTTKKSDGSTEKGRYLLGVRLSLRPKFVK